MRQVLHEAIERGEFFYEYQPIVRVGDGNIVAYEALARWHHRGAPVAACDFIRIADENGALSGIQNALVANLGGALAATAESIAFAINWAPSQLADPRQVTRFIGLAERLGLPAPRIMIEITETSAMHWCAVTVANVLRLKRAGFALALDDFGAGFCGLSYLRDLPVDQLKIDRSFVRDLSASEKTRSIVQTVIDLARKLEVEVVAEGVERQSQLDVLRAMQCDCVQGYLLGRPARGPLRVAPAGMVHPRPGCCNEPR